MLSCCDSMADRMGAIPLPVAKSKRFCVGKSYLNPSRFSFIGKPFPIGCEISMEDTPSVSQALFSCVDVVIYSEGICMK